jgi:hypothetical protein
MNFGTGWFTPCKGFAVELSQGQRGCGDSFYGRVYGPTLEEKASSNLGLN